ncbi:MAG: MFS transporter [Burkholderiaceae bacterium]
MAAHPRAGAWFRGWEVVAGCFVMATVAWGLGFYGAGLYLAYLTGERGLPIGATSAAITGYFWFSALLIMTCGPWIDRAGPRVSVTVGTLAMTAAVIVIAWSTRLWHFHAAMLAMSVGWTTMSSSAINAILAPWFDRKRGLALSIALTGASFGGIVVIPLLTAMIAAKGFRDGLTGAALVLAAVVLAVAWRCFVREPAAVGQQVDGDAGPRAQAARDDGQAPWPLARVLGSPGFLSNTVPFSIGLTVQVGFLTHQLSMLRPLIGAQSAAWAVGLTTVCAVAGRLLAGALMDRLERRALAALNFVLQAGGLLLLAFATEPVILYAGCVAAGLAVGNMITYPGLLIQREFPSAQFNRVNRLAVGITQFIYACGAYLMGAAREAAGDYRLPLLGCAALAAVAALGVWFGRPVKHRSVGADSA